MHFQPESTVNFAKATGANTVLKLQRVERNMRRQFARVRPTRLIYRANTTGYGLGDHLLCQLTRRPNVIERKYAPLVVPQVEARPPALVATYLEVL